MNRYRALPGALVLSILALAPGCRNTAEGLKQDSQKAEQEAKNLARKLSAEAKETGAKISEAAKEAGSKVAEGAKEVGDKVKSGAKEVASEAGAAKQTVDVKAHLLAAKSIDASQIDVETDSRTKTVTLTGFVPTAEQKAAAERLARESAGGYKVRNRLSVGKK
jgi:osmotically-inducible protein OsmY